MYRADFERNVPLREYKINGVKEAHPTEIEHIRAYYQGYLALLADIDNPFTKSSNSNLAPEDNPGWLSVISGDNPECLRKIHWLYRLCFKLDKQEYSGSSSSYKEILAARLRIGQAYISKVIQEQRKLLTSEEVGSLVQLTNVEKLAAIMLGLNPKIYKANPDLNPFTLDWLETTFPEEFSQIKGCLPRTEVGRINWFELKKYLYPTLADKFNCRVPTVSKDRAVLRLVEDYLEIIKLLDADAVAQALISLGKISEAQKESFLRAVQAQIGPIVSPSKIKLSSIPDISDELLNTTELRQLILIKLRNEIYQEFTAEGLDNLTLEAFNTRLSGFKQEVSHILSRKGFNLTPVQKELILEVQEYFDKVFAIKVPSRMNDRVVSGVGREHVFPSLRQRIAMHEIATDRRKLLAFFMGYGKTAATFLSKEHVGAKKMLYICPPNRLVVDIVSRIKKYYKEDQMPTVGVIRAGMSDEELRSALENEIVIFPFSMMSSNLKDNPSEGQEHLDESKKTRIVDLIISTEFDMVAVDEVHNAKNANGRNAKVVAEIVNGIPRLYEEGHIVLLSGDPTPNTPVDIAPQLKLLDPTYPEPQRLTRMLRSINSLVIRNLVLKYMLVLDPPEDWEKYTRKVEFSLNAEEQRAYNTVIADGSMTLPEKFSALCHLIANPSLFLDTEVDSSMLETLIAEIDDVFKTDDCVVVTENFYKQGITRPHLQSDRKTLYDRLVEHYGDDVQILIHDGDTSAANRDAMIEESKKPKKKTIIIAITSTINEGIDLSHINRAIMLSPDFNLSNTAQFVKRFARNGNEKAMVTLLSARNTIHSAVDEHARRKAELTTKFKYGGSLTDSDITLLEAEDNIRLLVDGNPIQILTAISASLLTDAQELARILGAMRGKGVKSIESFLKEHGPRLAELYTSQWEQSYSANNTRFTIGLIDKLLETWSIPSVLPGDECKVLDLGCGPVALAMASAGMGKLNISSLDLSADLIEAGFKMAKAKGIELDSHKVRVGSMTDANQFYEKRAFDVVNLGLSLAYTSVELKGRRKLQDVSASERVQTLANANFLLKENGVLVITFGPKAFEEDSVNEFIRAMSEHFGFEYMQEYSGQGRSIDGSNVDTFRNQTFTFRKTREVQLDGLLLNSLELKKQPTDPRGTTKSQTSKLENERFIHQHFELNSNEFEVKLPVVDKTEESIDSISLQARVSVAKVLLEEYIAKNNNGSKDLDGTQVKELERNGIIYRSFMFGSQKMYFFSVNGDMSMHPV